MAIGLLRIEEKRAPFFKKNGGAAKRF